MLEVADALAIVLQYVVRLQPESADLSSEILGRVLAADVRADRDSPPFDKSLRDGYAVRSADCREGDAELRIIEEVQAGAIPQKAVGPGEAARIFTGAPLPEGADAVVMQEDVQAAGERIRITGPSVKPRQWVYPRGREMRAGVVVLPTGTALNAAAIGVLAGVGQASASVYPAPTVGILATGNELVEPGEVPGPGQIRNSNGPMLSAQTARAGARPRYLGIARDDRARLRELIQDGLQKTDVLLLAGGVSAGDYDLVPAILTELGVAAHFHKVRMKPGKPLFFGTKDGVLVFGLPGNPVSSFVCFELFVRPALRKMAGHEEPGPTMMELPLAEALAASNDRPTYHPAALEPAQLGWAVRPLAWGGAPDLLGLRPADCLLALPAADARYQAGQPVSVVLL